MRIRKRTYRPRVRWRPIALTVCALALLASCGGSGKVTARPPIPSIGQSTPGTATTTASRPGNTSPRATATKKSGTTQASPKATSSGAVVARLDRACGRRGVDTQGLTVKTRPKGPVGFNTQYSDGSSLDSTHNYSGGYGGGFADDAGNYRNTWVIDATAPLGMATIRVATAEGTVDLTYLVVATNGSC
jgi:hypothetical protein